MNPDMEPLSREEERFGCCCTVLVGVVLPALVMIWYAFTQWPLKSGLTALVCIAEAVIFFNDKIKMPIRLAAAAAGTFCVLYIIVFLK